MENMRRIAIIAIIIVAAFVGYKAVQRYQEKHNGVRVQFLNFGTDDNYNDHSWRHRHDDNDDWYNRHHHNNSYERGFEAGERDAERRDDVRTQGTVSNYRESNG